MKKEPIAKFGRYGLHILKNPAGTYSFVGTIPVDLYTKATTYPTYEDAYNAFLEWQKIEDQKIDPWIENNKTDI